MLASAFLGLALAILAFGVRAAPQRSGNGGSVQQSSVDEFRVTLTAQSFTASGSLFPASTTLQRAAAITGTVVCNNSPELCNRAYNNITHLGAHDAPFLRDRSTSFSLSGNHFYNTTKALSAGLRLLSAQVHNSSGALRLCYTSCFLLDAGLLTTWSSEVRAWMDTNPHDVVTILLVNSDNNAASVLGSAFTSSGFSKHGYTLTSTTSPKTTWPTLQMLIMANKRLITFITRMDYSPDYPYLFPEFSFVFETAFGQTSADDFNCTLDRPASLSTVAKAISSGYMPLINHFRDTPLAFSINVPDVKAIRTTNSDSTTTVGALGLHGQSCATQWGIKPTLMLVDFWNVGPGINAAENLNRIAAVGRIMQPNGTLTANATSSAPHNAVSNMLVGGLGTIVAFFSLLLI